MSKRSVSIDGVVRSPEEAVVSVYDRGFLYGDGVFEVLRTYEGRPFALDQHLARLRRSAERVFIDVPVNDATWRSEIEAALAVAGGDESYVRIMVTRGAGPVSLDPVTGLRPLRVVLVEPLVPPPREAYANGIAAVTLATRLVVDGTSAAGAKVMNYLPNLLALKEARARGAQEAIVVDAQGCVVEGTSSNVFIVGAGRVATPPESAGILAGITRSHIFDVASHLSIPVDERTIVRADLYDADEVFITSSIRELVSVVRVDDRRIGIGTPGPVARMLHRRFRESVGIGTRPMPWE